MLQASWLILIMSLQNGHVTWVRSHTNAVQSSVWCDSLPKILQPVGQAWCQHSFSICLPLLASRNMRAPLGPVRPARLAHSAALQVPTATSHYTRLQSPLCPGWLHANKHMLGQKLTRAHWSPVEEIYGTKYTAWISQAGTNWHALTNVLKVNPALNEPEEFWWLFIGKPPHKQRSLFFQFIVANPKMDPPF